MPYGSGWRSYYDRSVQVLSGTQARLHRANGVVLDFTLVGGVWSANRAAGVLTASGSGWQYVITATRSKRTQPTAGCKA